jgi:hypothetical protein
MKLTRTSFAVALQDLGRAAYPQCVKPHNVPKLLYELGDDLAQWRHVPRSRDEAEHFGTLPAGAPIARFAWLLVRSSGPKFYVEEAYSRCRTPLLPQFRSAHGARSDDVLLEGGSTGPCRNWKPAAMAPIFASSPA